MNVVERVLHLVRRFTGMLSNEPVSVADRRWVDEVLSAREVELWERLVVADQRHSVQVARRLIEFVPDADRSAIAAALVHDIGKLDSNLGVGMRVLATVVGPRTARLRKYHDHERIGATMLRRIGADERTVALVECTSSDTEIAAALLAADNI